MLQPYGATLTQQCLSSAPIVFVGDSLARQLFWNTAARLDTTKAKKLESTTDKHSNITFKHNNVSVEFLWDPYIEKNETLDTIQERHKSDHHSSLNVTQPLVNIVLSSALWHIKNDQELLQTKYWNMLEKIAERVQLSPHDDVQQSHTPLSIAFLPPPAVITDRLDPGRAVHITQSRVESVVDIIRDWHDTETIDVIWALRGMTINSNASMQDDGIHLGPRTADALMNLLLNRFCNTRTFSTGLKQLSMCCTTPPSLSWLTPVVVFVFLVIVSCSYYWMDATTDLLRSQSRMAATGLFAITILSCWVADRTTVLSKTTKPTDETSFAFCAAACLLVGALTADKASKRPAYLPPNEKTEQSDNLVGTVLSRAQTEEWKGWMQITILLYHYFGMSKVLWVYKIVRLLVASYLFLTGYGHAMYFLQKLDFSLRRTAGVLIRLNLLAYALVLVMGNSYDFYYFPGLASLWYIITYCTFWRTSAKSRTSWIAALVRIAISATIVRTITASQGFVSPVFQYLEYVGGPSIDTHEFLFRVGLDLYAPYLGMLLALLRCHFEEPLIARLQKAQASTPRRRAMECCLHLTWMTLFCTYTMASWSCGDKYRYNEVHPMISMLPILGYIIVRNAWSTVSIRSVRLFVWVGKCSLETYVLQYHIWLAADTKGLLRLGILDVPARSSSTTVTSWPFWLETVLTTSIFLHVSNVCSNATGALVVWFAGACDKNTATNPRCALKNSLRLRVAILTLVMWTVNLSWRLTQ